MNERRRAASRPISGAVAALAAILSVLPYGAAPAIGGGPEPPSLPPPVLRTLPPSAPEAAAAPSPTASAGNTARPTPTNGQHRPNVSVSGIASWYRYHAGQAAAGPALRRALGPTWRGSVVRVCATVCLELRLTDWCACPGGRVIDLDSRDFAKLARLSRGLVPVRASW